MVLENFIAKEEIIKIANDILIHKIAKFEPTFEPLFGPSYKYFEGYELGKQLQLLKELEKLGLLKKELNLSFLGCSSCNFNSFSVRFVCTFCRSNKINRGTAIEHDFCGNVDLEHNYIAENGKLICKKCNKELKAIGVDYSKISLFYKCLECKTILPNAEQQYICLRCKDISIQEDLKLVEFFNYSVDLEKTSEISKEYNYMVSVVEDLEKRGIKSSYLGKILGKSNIEHSFTLIVYDDNNFPSVVIDKIEPFDDDKKTETTILSFIAKCLEVDISNKILLISVHNLKEDLCRLANTYGIIIIMSSNPNEARSKIDTIITDIMNKNNKETTGKGKTF